MSSRDPIEVLRERAAGLEEQIRELDQRRSEQSALEGRAVQVKAELEESRVLLDRIAGDETRGQARGQAHRQAHRRALPMLDAVRVASPCSARWEEMVGDDTSRFCSKCEKNVYNLSSMTREDAENVLRAREGELCVRLYQRADGTVLTGDCPVGVRKKRLRIFGALALGSSFAGAAAAFGLALQGDEPPPGVVEVSVIPAPIGSPVIKPSASPRPPGPPIPGSPMDPDGPFWTMGALSAPPVNRKPTTNVGERPLKRKPTPPR